MKKYFILLSTLLISITCISTTNSAEGKRLNNLLIELINTSADSAKLLNFTNPYDGWVYFGIKSESGKNINLSVKSETDSNTIIPMECENDGSAESMRYMPKGKYNLKVQSGNKSISVKIIVRSVPELIYSDFPLDPHVTAYGPYDWKYLEKNVFRNVNTMVMPTYLQPELIASAETLQHYRPYLIEWQKQGKHTLSTAGLPGTGINSIASLEQSYEYWKGQTGMINELSNGIIVDEFPGASKDTKYLTWAKAVDDLYKNGANLDKKYYAYTYGSPMVLENESKTFSDALIKHGGKIVLEWYPYERPDEKGVKADMDWYENDIQTWKKTYPDALRHLVINMGYSTSIGENLNVSLGVDFKVHMDRYMNWMANKPVFDGLYGIAWYKSSYADEEYVRWASKLFRHYCIEGKKNMLSDEYGYKYYTNHIENPDFTDGVKGWDISPASENSIVSRKMEGLGNQEGRYITTLNDGLGDTFLWINKSAIKPNKVSQIIKDLKPGKTYSIKMITADYTDMINGTSVRKINDVSIKVDDADIDKDKSFVQELRNYPGRQLPAFKGAPAWMNYHLIVFKAKNKTAKLTISDWMSDSNPGAWTNQELICNEIEIQPYFVE